MDVVLLNPMIKTQFALERLVRDQDTTASIEPTIKTLADLLVVSD
jgi:hypothetical protein